MDNNAAWILTLIWVRECLLNRRLMREQTVQSRRDVGCKQRDMDIDFSAVCTSIVECALYIMLVRAGVRIARLYYDARNRRARL